MNPTDVDILSEISRLSGGEVSFVSDVIFRALFDKKSDADLFIKHAEQAIDFSHVGLYGSTDDGWSVFVALKGPLMNQDKEPKILYVEPSSKENGHEEVQKDHFRLNRFGPGWGPSKHDMKERCEDLFEILREELKKNS